MLDASPCLLELLLQVLDRFLLGSDVLALFLALLGNLALLGLELGDGVLEGNDFSARLLVLGLQLLDCALELKFLLLVLLNAELEFLLDFIQGS